MLYLKCILLTNTTSYMARRESVLSEMDKESINIERFIFHIIVESEAKPHYLKELILTQEQKEFFKHRLIDVAQGLRFIFVDKENAPTYDLCKNIIDDNGKFVQLSKRLANSFQEHHDGKMTDGVFVTALVGINDNISYIFLLKIDNRLVYKYNLNKDRPTLEKIKKTFVEDPKAVQKMALISLSNVFSWDVLAFDRVGKKGDIGQYFKKFLGVQPKDDIYELTCNSFRRANVWARDNIELTNGELHFKYRQRAIDYLSSHMVFNSDEFIESVIGIDDDENRRNAAIASFKGYLQEHGIYGQNFNISKKALSKTNAKHSIRTAENLTLSWEGDPAAVNLEIPTTADNDGYYSIRIRTRVITDTTNND